MVIDFTSDYSFVEFFSFSIGDFFQFPVFLLNALDKKESLKYNFIYINPNAWIDINPLPI